MYVQSNLCTTTTLGIPTLWSLFRGSVSYVMKTVSMSQKWWPLWAGGRYLDVVISSGKKVGIMNELSTYSFKIINLP